MSYNGKKLAISKNSTVVFILFLLMNLDYVLTFSGISLGIISEGNPLLPWLFDLSFPLGLLLRAVFSSLMMIPFILYMNKNPKQCKTVLYCLNGIYSLVILLHLRWIAASAF